MITVKNIQTGELHQVNETYVNEQGRIFARWAFPEPSAKYYEKHQMLSRTDETIRDTKHNVECRVLALADGWEVVSNPKKERKPRTPKTPKEEVSEIPEVPEVKEEKATITPAPKTYTSANVEALRQELTNKYGSMGAGIFAAVEKLVNVIRPEAQVDKSMVEGMIDERMKSWSDNGRAAKVVEVRHSDGRTCKVEGVVCEGFEDMVQDEQDGFFVYMYGAAGCGKSYTAGQIAKALDIPFYPMQQLLFAHQVEGYGNAAGEYVPTPFYEAFTNGGLVFFDEWDSSAPEAALIVNGAIANRRYNFPVVGVKEAHKDFRVIAAGNTIGCGADTQYTGRATLDASTRDRMVFYEMYYDRRIELPIMAGGDEEICDFVEDVREAIKTVNIEHIVSYRATEYMAAHKDSKRKALMRSVFKGMRPDEVRVIYGALKNTSNAWAKEMKKMF